MDGVTRELAGKPAHGKFPKWVFAMAFAISTAANVFGGLQLRQLHDHFLETTSRHNAILESVGRIMLYDEILTMSARMAAATGDFSYEQRYEHFDAQLTQELKSFRNTLASNSMQTYAAETGAANDELVETEKRSFELVHQGNLAEAMSLLNTSNYLAAKSVYAKGMEKSIQGANEVIEADRGRLEQFFLNLIAANIASVLVIFSVWFFAARSARNWIALQKQAEAALRESEERWQLALEGAGNGVWDWNTLTDEVKYSPHWKEMLGFADEEIGTGFNEWRSRVHPDDLPAALDSLQAYFDGKTPGYLVEHRLKCKDGHWKWVLSRGMIVARNTEGKPLRVIGTHADITDRKQWEQRLEQQARTDFLTGVANRRHFIEEAEQELARAQRYRLPLSIAMIDLDFFKAINDTYGHEMGDRVLKELAKICRATLREIDLVGRIGGEEFAVLFPQTDGVHAFEIAERLREAISAAEIPMTQGLPIHFEASIGIASFRESDANIDVLLNRADQALYEAKRIGRNRTCSAND